MYIANADNIHFSIRGKEKQITNLDFESLYHGNENFAKVFNFFINGKNVNNFQTHSNVKGHFESLNAL